MWGSCCPVCRTWRASAPRRKKYLQKAKIPPALLEHPEAPVPLRLAYRFLNEACRAEGIENVGLHVGCATSLSEPGEFGEILLSARNVLEYFERGVRFAGAVTSGDSYRLDQEGEWIRFSHRQEGPGTPESDKQYSYLFSLSVTTRCVVLPDRIGVRPKYHCPC